MIRTRKEYETLERTLLAPYASHSADSRGREFQEPEHSLRSRFQRDRDRVIHTKAFRRLEYKTQVFVNHEGDHYRTRLTHSIEAAQISRSVARMLRLNEDLAEAIALAHDLGHPPFGHSGEAMINDIMQNHGGFEHNRHSMRIVMLLEHPYPNFSGLNLSEEVLEGVAKHFKTYSPEPGRVFKRPGEPSLEAQLVNLADEIAYNHHDLDDGLRSGMIHPRQLEQLAIWESLTEMTRDQHPSLSSEPLAQATVKNLINYLVQDLVEETRQRLSEKKISSKQDVTHRGKDTVAFSPAVRNKTAELKKFLFTHMYRHYRVERMAEKANRLLRDLFEAYLLNPKILPPEVFEKTRSEEPHRVICDYIAGMTDRFVLEEHDKLFNPHSRV